MSQSSANQPLALAWHQAVPPLKLERARVRQEAPRVLVDEWERGIAEVALDHANLQAEGAWTTGPSDLLSIIGRARRETFHCAVLAWLMDPTAPHGLATAFLARFLESSGWLPGDGSQALSAAVTYTEVRRTSRLGDRTLDRRADIVVRAPGLCLVIEAKVDHWESDGQCHDTWELWRFEEGAHFVFLTPRGHAATSASGPARQAFHAIGFDTLRDLLSDCLEAAPSPLTPGRASALSYLQTLRQEFR